VKRILLIQGHPDPAGGHFGHALADAYARGAARAGHEIEKLEVAGMDFPLLRTKSEFEQSPPCPVIRAAQRSLENAEHVVIFFPLWLGGMPALLKGFLEQLLRPGFAFDMSGPLKRKLKGRSARIVVTMGMPSFVFRWYFSAHGLKALTRSILGFCGFRPIATNIVGNVEGAAEGRHAWLAKMDAFGVQAK
jgi:putative NADPH-quinone reductase